MIDYFAEFINTNGSAFPNTLAINATGPTTTDGTEFIKLLVDDSWGYNQALLDYAGLTPNGITEAPGASQRLEALKKGFAIGPGIGVTYWKNDTPVANGDRVLILQGQGVLRSSYSDLDDAVYVGDANNATASAFYHADDAAGTIRNTTGIYLILPDCRGVYLRGIGTHGTLLKGGGGAVVGPNLGQAENDQILDHDHDLFGKDVQGAALTWAGGALWNLGFAYTNLIRSGQNYREGTETRGFGVGAQFGITY